MSRQRIGGLNQYVMIPPPGPSLADLQASEENGSRTWYRRSVV